MCSQRFTPPGLVRTSSDLSLNQGTWARAALQRTNVRVAKQGCRRFVLVYFIIIFFQEKKK